MGSSTAIAGRPMGVRDAHRLLWRAGFGPRRGYGHDHLWWLDRMIRSDRPLVERLTLTFHDWFATSNEKVDNHGR